MKQFTIFILFFLSFQLGFFSPVLAEEEFAIGQVNSSEVILNLKTLTGVPISEIERKARPCEFTDWEDCSTSGFIGAEESLLERLAKDNDFVLSQGLTHQKLAEPLLHVMDAKNCKRQGEEFPVPFICEYNGKQYDVKQICTMGFQVSIFNDPYRVPGSCDYTVKNIRTNQEISYAEMVAHYVHLYGFFEGDVPYRLDPKLVIEVFELKGE